MPVDNRLAELLACPRCDKALDATDDGYRCSACKVDFNTVAGLPWLFADDDASLGEWRNRLHFALQQLSHEIERLRADVNSVEAGSLALQRLELQLDANEKHRSALQQLLAPFEVSSMQSSYDSYLALRTRLPTDQGLNTYYANVHRDWAWGDEENAASLQQISSVIDSDASPGDTLVLGCGAGRLAYDIHMQLPTRRTVAVDFNPLLLLIGKAASAGETLSMYEFPIAPKTMNDSAILRELCAPEPVREDFYLVAADVLRPPFLAASFDTVVTPWLIDIVSEDLKLFARRINQLLKPGGQWINFGSLAFEHADRKRQYCLEEVLEIVQSSGFDEPQASEATIPYMCSPASRHGRLESVVSFSAVKSGDEKSPPKHRALPDWIVTGKEPVPLSESFRTQAMSTRIYSYIMSLVDGKRTIKDMAKVLEQQQLMTRAEAESAIRGFLTRMYDDSQRDSNF